jgi:4'-phosphopantetheinyl transferase
VIYWHLCSANERTTEAAARPDFLSASEQRTYAGLRLPKRRHEWLLGRWTAKQLLQKSVQVYRHLPFAAISVANDLDGAPYLAVEGEGRLPVSLSISHRAGRALCALSPALSPSIGADLERIEPRAEAFVNDFFTEDEAARVWACPESSRDTLVSLIWSAKEAVLKALREGLRLDTRVVEIGHVPRLEASPPPEGATSHSSPALAPRLAGEDAAGAAWHPLGICCRAPGALRFAAWWRTDGDNVLTLAAAWP